MAGLVEEIQTKVLDKSVGTTELLRMVKLAAVKLKLDDTVAWVDCELKGYEGETGLPDYRKTTGELKCHNPLRGPMPVYGDAENIRKLSERNILQPISDVEELAANAGGEAWGKLPQSVIDVINASSGGPPMDYYVHIPNLVFQNISQQVRNLILDWAIEMEKAGVLGDGMKFSSEEQKKAEEAAQNVTIHNYGHLHQGDVTGHQNRTVVGSTDQSINSLEINDTFDQLIQAVDSNIGNQNDRDAIIEIVKAMQAAQGTPEYKPLFQKWVGYVAEYTTILGPFVPALSGLIG
ncbi:MAG: hypothetical protein KKA44_14205 [Alphaproteobacteria bacterium]|nr:hypothetical protein [Alphaproteobacteria bacterium]MBU0864723.1 hypothetical protein [Alphaproteobacteria bacterium]MBU1826108.1 hypothetical protein [Alphaproteobacteria bacterium]